MQVRVLSGAPDFYSIGRLYAVTMAAEQNERRQVKLLLAAFILTINITSPLCAQTSKDVCVMPGSDISRPGLNPRSNLNVGIGLSMERLQGMPLGNEVTFAYTYENAGSHGFWHTDNGAHTESVGMMKNMAVSEKFGLYTWIQYGLTSFTGYPKGVKNRMYSGYSLGGVYHLSKHNGIWIQETYNKVSTVPWYASTNLGYAFNW